MKFLITGGAGFIGSHFCKYLINNYKNATVVCYDKLTYAGNLNNLKDIINNKNFVFVQGDICNEMLVNSVIEGYNITTIVNFAAESHVDRSIESGEQFLKTNVIGLSVLLNLAVKHNLRFHQVSTDEVYGDLPLESDKTFTEESALNPSSYYSASKASGDLLLLSSVKTYNLRATISRSVNNFGLNQHEEKLLPKTIYFAMKDQSIPIYGNGENIRDWLFVEEHCRAIDLILKSQKYGEIYNVGAKNELSNIQLVKKVLDIMNKPHSLITFVEDRKGHDKKYSVNCNKIANELAFYPNNNFEQNLKLTVEGYMQKWR